MMLAKFELWRKVEALPALPGDRHNDHTGAPEHLVSKLEIVSAWVKGIHTRAISSVVERLLHTQEVAGSNPASRTFR